MERLNVRMVALAGAFLVSGLFLMGVGPGEPPEGEDEAWLESMAPMTAGNYTFDPPKPGQGHSFKMDDASYELLNPIGMVGRYYSDGDNRIEVVLIASSDKNSFHDPRVCFRGQNYELEDLREGTVETDTRGAVPVTLTRLTRPGARDQMAAFSYRGPDGFASTTLMLFRQFLWAQIKGDAYPDGIFYRFIAMDDVTEDEFVTFISQYFDSANASSDGYF